MSKIINVTARIVYDGRGWPTPEIEIQTVCGLFRASASTQPTYSRHDVVELRDGDKNWGSRGVQKCIDQIRTRLRPIFTGLDIQSIDDIDKKIREVDESSDGRLGVIGSNSALPLSMVCVQAAAAYFRTPLYRYIQRQAGSKCKMPTLAFSMASGGSSGGPSYIRDYYVISLGNLQLQDQLQNYYTLLNEARKQLKTPTVSNTGGFILDADQPEEVMKQLVGWIKGAGLDGKMQLVLDIAANDFVDPKDYKYELSKYSAKTKTVVAGSNLIEKYAAWTQQFMLYGVQDPFYYEDFGSYQELMKKKLQVFGCQLFNSRADRVQYMLKHERGQLAHQVTLQITSVGLISEIFKCYKKAAEYSAPVSLISPVGETEDAFSAHMAVGLGCDFFFVGGVQKGERVEKVNELLRIEQQMK